MTITDMIIAGITNGYGFIYTWGYAGVFLVVLISSASLFFFPIPGQAFIFSAGGIWNPFLVAIISVVASSIGETTGYLTGLGGKELLKKKYGNQLKKTSLMFEKYGSFIWIFIATVSPFPVDVASIFCGVIKYDFKKYFLALFAGKIVINFLLAYAGHYSVNWILDYYDIRI